MSSVQIIEMCNQRRDTSSSIEWFKHMAANKFGQVTHRLHRNRLMKQLQRLFVINPQTPPKPGTVLGKTILDIRTVVTQSLSQLRNVGAKVSKVRGNTKLTLGAH